MLEPAQAVEVVSDEDYQAESERLRVELLDAQYELLERRDFSVIVLINGIDGAGRSESVNLLNEWMDPRHVETTAFDDATPDEAAHPFMWRFWKALPPRGKIGLLFNNWYTEPIRARVERRSKRAQLSRRLEKIRRFEAMLVNEGVLLVKLWFHLSKREQKKRLKALEKDERTSWRVTERDWHFHDLHERYCDVASEALGFTHTEAAPWLVVDGRDPNHRALVVGRTLLAALRGRLAGVAPQAAVPDQAGGTPFDAEIAARLDAIVRQDLGRKEYENLLEPEQGRLARLLRRPQFGRRSLVLVFEGMDAAGKGGAIRRITAALDARLYRVVPISAPNADELAEPYLWRFWHRIPPHRKVVMFDRSWYGRVLVERVEGYCSDEEWMRAYGEINDFEQELSDDGAIVIKFWLQISKDEQLQRFEERQSQAHKFYKITEDDWRNRSKWEAYAEAARDMVARTHTATAPWTLIEADDKHFGRIKILRSICERLEAEFG